MKFLPYFRQYVKSLKNFAIVGEFDIYDNRKFDVCVYQIIIYTFFIYSALIAQIFEISFDDLPMIIIFKGHAVIEEKNVDVADLRKVIFRCLN